MEDKEGIYCISSGLCVALDIQENLLKAEIYGKEMKDKFIKERFDPINNIKKHMVIFFYKKISHAQKAQNA